MVTAGNLIKSEVHNLFAFAESASAGEFAAAFDCGLRNSVALKLFECARLHDQGVVHADVHARNAIIDRSGSIKLIDFDQSVIAGEPDDIARSGHIEYYLAPEQARSITDSGEYLRPTANSEQYSIAVLLYFLITGAYPIDFSVDRRDR